MNILELLEAIADKAPEGTLVQECYLWLWEDDPQFRLNGLELYSIEPNEAGDIIVWLRKESENGHDAPN